MRPSSPEGFTEMARETVLDLGHLVGQHVLVAQLEVKAELRALSRRARLIVALAALAAIGYALAMAGLAVVLAGRAALGLPLVIIGGAHVVVAGVGLASSRIRVRGAPAMGKTIAAVNGSLAALETIRAR